MRAVGLLQFLTVQIVVMAVFTLRIVDAIPPDGTLAVISGVVGYILGNLTRKGTTEDKGERKET
jgi:hypothetical protein